MQSTERGAGKHTAFVAPIRRREMPDLPLETSVVHTIDAAPQATQHIEMKTSAVDRAQGHLIASVPLYAAFATATVAVCVLGFGMPWISLPTITIFLIVFTAAWFFSWTYQLQISAEGVSYFEATKKWGVIEKEHDRRWEAWYEQLGGSDESD